MAGTGNGWECSVGLFLAGAVRNRLAVALAHHSGLATRATGRLERAVGDVAHHRAGRRRRDRQADGEWQQRLPSALSGASLALVTALSATTKDHVRRSAAHAERIRIILRSS